MKNRIPTIHPVRSIWSRRLAVLGASLMLATHALSTTYTVTNDANSGVGSLRWAVGQCNSDSNNAANPTDTIVFDATYFSVPRTITLTSDELYVSDASGTTIIAGPGAELLTIDGNDSWRAFFIKQNALADISGLTIANGWAFEGKFFLWERIAGWCHQQPGYPHAQRGHGQELPRRSLHPFGAHTRRGHQQLWDAYHERLPDRGKPRKGDHSGGAAYQGVWGRHLNTATLVASNCTIRDNLATAFRHEPGSGMVTIGAGAGVCFGRPGSDGNPRPLHHLGQYRDWICFQFSGGDHSPWCGYRCQWKADHPQRLCDLGKYGTGRMGGTIFHNDDYARVYGAGIFFEAESQR